MGALLNPLPFPHCERLSLQALKVVGRGEMDALAMRKRNEARPIEFTLCAYYEKSAQDPTERGYL